MKKEFLTDNDVLNLCNVLEDSNQSIVISSEHLERFNFIHKNVFYSEQVPPNKCIKVDNIIEFEREG